MLADGTWTGTYAYDGAGRLNRIPQPGGSDYIAAMTYNARGQAETVTYGNGAVASYGYSPERGWMTSVGVSGLGVTPLDLTYERSGKGMGP